MKKLLILIVAIFISVNLFGQNDSTRVAFVSYWSVGDSYDFIITKTKQQWSKDSLTKDEKHEYIANFKVIDSTKNSYSIKWTFENELMNTYKIPQELKERLSKYNMTEVLYKTNELGEFIEISNWKEIGKIMNKMFNDIIEVLSKNEEKKNKDAIKNAMQQYTKMYSSKEGVELLVLKELQLFHYPMGVDFDISEPVIYDDELPNMLGGEPIKAKTKLYFDKVNFEENFCILKQETTLDQEDSKAIISTFLKNSKLESKKMDEKLESTVFKIYDNNTYEFYYNPGIPKKIEAVRTTILDFDLEKVKRIDKTIIELVD